MILSVDWKDGTTLYSTQFLRFESKSEKITNRTTKCVKMHWFSQKNLGDEGGTLRAGLSPLSFCLSLKHLVKFVVLRTWHHSWMAGPFRHFITCRTSPLRFQLLNNKFLEQNAIYVFNLQHSKWRSIIVLLLGLSSNTLQSFHSEILCSKLEKNLNFVWQNIAKQTPAIESAFSSYYLNGQGSEVKTTVYSIINNHRDCRTLRFNPQT